MARSKIEHLRALLDKATMEMSLICEEQAFEDAAYAAMPALLDVAEALRCQEAYSHARVCNDWMHVLWDGGWDGFESPTTFLHRQRRHALAALDEVTT